MNQLLETALLVIIIGLLAAIWDAVSWTGETLQDILETMRERGIR